MKNDWPDYDMFDDVPAQVKPNITYASVNAKMREFLDAPATKADWSEADSERLRRLNDPRVQRICFDLLQKLDARVKMCKMNESTRRELWLEFLKGAGL